MNVGSADQKISGVIMEQIGTEPGQDGEASWTVFKMGTDTLGITKIAIAEGTQIEVNGRSRMVFCGDRVEGILKGWDKMEAAYQPMSSRCLGALVGVQYVPTPYDAALARQKQRDREPVKPFRLVAG
jgi:hypothetical protein